MNQERILKIIKGLNTFSLDDLIMMTDTEEIEALNIVAELVIENKIAPINDNEYRYLNNYKYDKTFLRLVEKIDLKTIKENKNITFKQAAEYFLVNHASINCTPSSFKTYKSILKTNLLPFFGEMKLFNIKQENIKEFLEIDVGFIRE